MQTMIPRPGRLSTEVVLNRISSNGSVTVNGIHVHQTAISAGFADGNWEAIVTATAGESLKVSYSLVTIDATSDPAPGQAFGVVATYNTQSIEVDHVHFGPYFGDFDPAFANYGVSVNGSSDPLNTMSITNNEFEAGTTRNVGVKLAGQVGGPQVVIEGNSFEEPGTAQGAIRIDDEGQNLPGPQDFQAFPKTSSTATASKSAMRLAARSSTTGATPLLARQPTRPSRPTAATTALTVVAATTRSTWSMPVQAVRWLISPAQQTLRRRAAPESTRSSASKTCVAVRERFHYRR